MKKLTVIIIGVIALYCSPAMAQDSAQQAKDDSVAIELAAQALARNDRDEMNRILKPLKIRGKLQQLGIAGTAVKQEAALRLYADMMGIFAAQTALKSGDRTKMARILKPLALRGNESAIDTLKLMGITNFAPPSKPVPKKVVPKISDAQRIKSDLDTCFANPTNESMDLNISACESVHSHFRIEGGKESLAIKAMAVNERTDAAYKNHDDYFYRSGSAAFQLAKLHNAKTPNKHDALCPYLHKAAKQFSFIHARPARGSASWKTIATTHNLLKACKVKGL